MVWLLLVVVISMNTGKLLLPLLYCYFGYFCYCCLSVWLGGIERAVVIIFSPRSLIRTCSTWTVVEVVPAVLWDAVEMCVVRLAMVQLFRG